MSQAICSHDKEDTHDIERLRGFPLKSHWKFEIKGPKLTRHEHPRWSSFVSTTKSALNLNVRGQTWRRLRTLSLSGNLEPQLRTSWGWSPKENYKDKAISSPSLICWQEPTFYVRKSLWYRVHYARLWSKGLRKEMIHNPFFHVQKPCKEDIDDYILLQQGVEGIQWGCRRKCLCEPLGPIVLLRHPTWSLHSFKSSTSRLYSSVVSSNTLKGVTAGCYQQLWDSSAEKLDLQIKFHLLYTEPVCLSSAIRIWPRLILCVCEGTLSAADSDSMHGNDSSGGPYLRQFAFLLCNITQIFLWLRILTFLWLIFAHNAAESLVLWWVKPFKARYHYSLQMEYLNPTRVGLKVFLCKH